MFQRTHRIHVWSIYLHLLDFVWYIELNIQSSHEFYGKWLVGLFPSKNPAFSLRCCLREARRLKEAESLVILGAGRHGGWSCES